MQNSIATSSRSVPVGLGWFWPKLYCAQCMSRNYLWTVDFLSTFCDTVRGRWPCGYATASARGCIPVKL